MQSAPQVTQNPLHSRKVGLTRSMHVKAHLLYRIGDVQPSESEILQSSNEAPVVRSIAQWVAIRC